MIAALKKAIGMEPRPRFEQLMQERFTPTAVECENIDFADTEHRKRVELLSSFSADKPREDLRSLRAMFAAQPCGDTAAALEDAELNFPRSVDVNRDMHRRAREACRDHAVKVLEPIARPIFARAAGLVSDRMRELEAEERLILEKHAVTFEPSPLLKALEAFHAQLSRAAAGMVNSPRTTLREHLAILFR
jgi:hypothetical protein